MRFVMIGAGAMGSIIGGYLKKGGADICFVDPDTAHINAIKDKGLTIVVDGVEQNIPVECHVHGSEVKGNVDVAIFLTKGYDTETAARQAECFINSNTLILTLQNGLGNPEILSRVYGRDDILYGVMQFGGIMLSPGKVKGLLSADSLVIAGSMKKDITPQMEEMASHFVKGGFNFQLTRDPDQAVWVKTLGNCANNAMCGITRLEMGPYFGCETGELVAQALECEVRAIAKAKGISLPPPKASAGGGFKESSPMYHHLTSTAQDMHRHKRTEISNLNGYMVEEGKRLGIPTPYNQMVTWTVSIIENNYEKQF